MDQMMIKINEEPEKGNYIAPGVGPAENQEEKVKSDQFNAANNVSNNNDEKKSKPWIAIFTLEYYQEYFDINSSEVGKRVVQSFKPHSSEFFEIAKRNPDLYGPFWILTTLVFTIAAAGNFSRYLHNNKVPSEFNFVPVAAGLIYGFGFIVPVIVTIMMRMFGTKDITFIQVLCIYGYSMSCFIIVTFLCILPYSKLQWIFLAYGIINSSAFLMVNFWKELGNYVDKKRYAIIGFIFGTQLILLLTYKFYFFGKVFSENA